MSPLPTHVTKFRQEFLKSEKTDIKQTMGENLSFFILNAMSLQGMNDHGPPRFPFVYYQGIAKPS